jgi:hypothetical protein
MAPAFVVALLPQPDRNITNGKKENNNTNGHNIGTRRRKQAHEE